MRPVQAAMLENLHNFGGLFGPVAVSAGKTLPSFLAAAVLESKKPMLCVPAGLKKKTEDDWWKLSTHWKLPPIYIETYERISVAKNAGLLLEYKPDLLFFDEAQCLKNTRAAVTRRVARYLMAVPTRVAIVSGTLTTKSLRDYWHLLRWALGPEQMPLPKQWEEMMEWAECLDTLTLEEGTAINRMAPGCLAEFSNGDESLEAVRRGFQRRFVESPGVVATTDRPALGSLLIVGQDVPVPNEHYRTLRQWKTPDGHDFSDAVTLWRHARELVCGFYNVWDPRPPKEWMDKRREWHRFVREVLKHSRTYDTELQVAGAVSRGLIDAHTTTEDGAYEDVYAAWKEIKPTFKPNPVPVWVSDVMLNFAANWLERTPGICWAEHPEFGIKLSQMTGLPYFGRKGLDAQGRLIDNIPGGPVIASVLANHRGRNLQFGWSENLVVACPPNAAMIEQLLGRTHRDGQEADSVTYRFVTACREQLEGMYKAVLQAEYIEQTTGQPQKLLYGDRVMMTPDEMVLLSGERWS